MTTRTRTTCAAAIAFALVAIGAGTPAAAEPGTKTSRSTTASHHQPTLVERIVAQERARRGDPSVLGAFRQEPVSVQIVERPGGFDWGDAGIGGAATLSFALLVAGGVALRHDSRRQEAHG